MTSRNPHDLSQIRPDAALHGAGPRPGAGPVRRRPPPGRRRKRRRQPPARRGWSLFGRIAVGLAVVVALAGAGLAAFLVLVSPAELVRNEMVRQVKANTGRDLRINGGAHFVFYPNIGVSLDQVELSPPPGMAGGPMLVAKQINVSVALMPLLNQQVLVNQVGLVRPVIDLHVDGKGRQNWEFAGPADRRVRVAGLGSGLIGGARALSDGPAVLHDIVMPAVLPAAAASGGWLEKLELRSIRLTKAIIRYRDEQTGTAQQINDLDLQLAGRRISDPLTAQGALLWQNEKINFDARLDTLAQLLANGAAKARVTMTGRPASAGFDGTVKLGKAVQVAGQTRLSGASLVTTAGWLGMALPNAAPLGGFQVSGRLSGTPKSIALNNASISIGATRATGVIRVAMRPTRPALSADLTISNLDVDRLSAGFAGARALPQAPRRPVTPATGRKPPPKSIDDLLRRSQVPAAGGAGRFAPQVRGYTNRNEWSSKRIEAAALGLIDAKARLRITGLKVAGLAIDSAVVRLALANQAAQVDIDDIKLYGGAGKGVITVRPGRRGLGIGANLRVDKITARPMLKDAADFDRLDGRGDLVVVVSGAGESQKALANSLNGTARFAFRDGAIVGWNLAKVIRGLQRGQFSNFDAVASEQTDFSELGASFKITGGVATTQDLRMTSPLLRLSGQGDVGIGARNLNLALRPRLVSSLRGQGARGDSVGLDLPVKLKGPWHDPRVVPDIKGLTQDPSRLVNEAKKLGRQFKGKSVGDIVRGVLGNDGGEGDGAAHPSEDIKPKDLLKKLFR